MSLTYSLYVQMTVNSHLAHVVWNNVKPKLLEILRTERAHRDEKAFVAKWYVRREALRGPYNAFVHARRDEELWARTMPGFEEMIRKPAMAGLLTSARPSEPITEEQFATIQPDIAREAREALQTAIAVLAQVVRDAEAQEGADCPACTADAAIQEQEEQEERE